MTGIVEGPFQRIVALPQGGSPPWRFKNHSHAYGYRMRGWVAGPSSLARYTRGVPYSILPAYSGDFDHAGPRWHWFQGGANYYGTDGLYYQGNVAGAEAPVDETPRPLQFYQSRHTPEGEPLVVPASVEYVSWTNALRSTSPAASANGRVIRLRVPAPARSARRYQRVLCAGEDVTDRVMWGSRLDASTSADAELYLAPGEYPGADFTVVLRTGLQPGPRGDPVVAPGAGTYSMSARLPHIAYRGIKLYSYPWLGEGMQGTLALDYEQRNEDAADNAARQLALEMAAETRGLRGQVVPLAFVPVGDGRAPEYRVRPDAEVTSRAMGRAESGEYWTASASIHEPGTQSSPSFLYTKTVTEQRAANALLVGAAAGTLGGFSVGAALVENGFDPASGLSFGAHVLLYGRDGVGRATAASRGDPVGDVGASRVAWNVPITVTTGDVPVESGYTTLPWQVDPRLEFFRSAPTVSFALTASGVLEVFASGTPRVGLDPVTRKVAEFDLGAVYAGVRTDDGSVVYQVDYARAKKIPLGSETAFLFDCVRV